MINAQASMKKILEYLQQLELSELEAKLYLTLLDTGAVSVRELAEIVGVKRTTAYMPLEMLVEKGLVLKVMKGSKSLVTASDPEESLQRLVAQKAQKAQTIQSNFPTMLQLITTVMPQGGLNTNEAEIKYYKGKAGIKKIYQDALKSQKLRSYVNIEEVLSVFPDNAQLFDTAFKNNPNMKMFEIVENSPQAKKRFEHSTKKEHYFYKFLPEGLKLTAQDILIYENKVAIIHFKDKMNSIVLYNTDLYHNFKLLFDYMWQTLPESNPKSL
jgi:sugar-specific transcriptional regulator TrmB